MTRYEWEVLEMNKVIKFIKMNLFEKRVSLCRNTYSLFHKHQFARIGERSYIYHPLFLSGVKYISLGNDVGIWHNARIEVIDEWNGQHFEPRLSIGDNVLIGQDLHLTLANRIEIEDDVVCSGRVTITDISHITDDSTLPVLDQGIITKPVRICKGAFIGINVVVLPGVTIGKHAIIGSSSVVTKDVPDYATVVGAPARIIKTRAGGNTDE